MRGVKLFIIAGVLLLFGYCNKNPKILIDPSELAPDFNFTTLNGKSLNLKKFNGKPLIICFSIENIDPCSKAVAAVLSLQKKITLDTVQTLIISKDKVGRPALQEGTSVNYTLSLVDDGSIFDKYNIYRLPTTVCIDKYGREIKRLEGFSNARSYTAFLKSIFSI